MSFFLYLIAFYLLFKFIGGIVVNYLLNSGLYQKRHGQTNGQFSSDFQKIFQELFNNLNQNRGNHYSSNTNTNSNSQSNRQSSVGGKMSRQEALELLDLDNSAKSDDIQKAHHRLMKINHPDKGGSKAIAQKLNEAKDLLLNK